MLALVVLAGLWTPTAAGARDSVLLVLGDSLSAAYGIESDGGWTSLLDQRLRERGHPHVVVNASISGETSAGGLARVDELLERHRPAVVVVELGGNDGLRGIALEQMRENLRAVLERSRAAGARTVLVQMRLPPNYGPDYVRRFESTYAELAAQTGAVLAPFLLDGVAESAQLMQEDGIHPRQEAQPRMLDNLWPSIEAVLQSAAPPAS